MIKRSLVFFLVVCFCLSFICSKSIILEYPTEVIAGQIFNVNLSLVDFPDNVYDVKIDIYNITTSNRIAEIYNGTVWKSTNYYVNGIINTSISNNSLFLLNITSSYNGTANLSVSIRRNGATTSDVFSDYSINVTFIPSLICIQNWSCSSWSSCSSSSQTRTCTDTRNCGNLTGKPIESQTCTDGSSNNNDEIEEYIELDWEREDIINGEEFEIEVLAYNLENEDYDVKVWIENSDNKIITEIYEDSNDKWISGIYYINDFFSSSGDESESVKLRIKKEYTSFSGRAKIYAKLRKNSVIVDETEYNINILRGLVDDTTSSSSSNTNLATGASIANNQQANYNEQIILLGAQSSLSHEKNGKVIYSSKTELIKKYAPYLFCLICVILIIVLVIDKRIKNPQNEEIE